MIRAYLSMWKNIFNFSGTTTVREYWLSLIGNVIAMFAGVLLLGLVFTLARLAGLVDYLNSVSPVFTMTYMLVFQVPIISLIVRRIRDSNFPFLPVVLLVLWIPVMGAMLAGILKRDPSAPKFPLILRIGYTMMAFGGGLYLWALPVMLITGQPVESFGGMMAAGLLISTTGLMISYRSIVNRSKEKRNNQ